MSPTCPNIDNFISGSYQKPQSGNYLDVITPHTGKVCAKVALSSTEDVNAAVQAAATAFPGWSGLTVKTRAAKMLKLYHLIQENSDELARLVSLENGKTYQEALASVSKGNETVEWSCSLPQIMQGKILQVSRGVTCQDQYIPVGVVASIVPFNFPLMVPMWTTPIALVAGNCMVLKPSEKCPLTMNRVSELISLAGIPPGVFNIVNGQKEVVNSLIDHPDVKAVTFVGSSVVAELVYKRATSLCKKVLSLGGAKNHLITLSDCDIEMSATDILSSFAGCAGQRCMAASVLITVGSQKKLIDLIVSKAKELKPGDGTGCMGPVIDELSKNKILKYIHEAQIRDGAQILLDGRTDTWLKREGTWVGPTVILHWKKEDPALSEEIFGPVLSVYEVSTDDEAIQIENDNPYGNAACVYTSSGAMAQFYTERFRAGMIGVNIGIPVPREPFSFGGLYGTKSKYGEHDITGEGALQFFTSKQKITTKWAKFETGRKEDITQFK